MNALYEEFEGAIYFRQERAKKFPDDERNADAVVMLEKLRDMPNADRDLASKYHALIENESVEGDKWASVHSEAMRSIGFGWNPETSDEVLGRILTDLGIDPTSGPTKATISWKKENQSFSKTVDIKDIEATAEEVGYGVTGVHDDKGRNSYLRGLPIFKGLHGPCGSSTYGDTVWYECWETHRINSAD